MIFGTRRTINNLQQSFSRDDLRRKSRILVVDDERPELIDDLTRMNYAITYEKDITPDNISSIEQAFYDLVILDFGDIGKAMGDEEGLSILKHLKRTNPSVIVIAYTSKSLPAEHAGFYRLADNVLPKDAGISASTEKIDEALEKAHRIENVWRGILAATGTKPGSKRDRGLQHHYVKALENAKKRRPFQERVLGLADDDETKKVALKLVGKLLELGISASLA